MILNTINSPEDLKRLSLSELNSLSKEIRHRIIEVLSINGGHLGSNLGAIELTLALHFVFSSPKDKFIWDVSHQVYTHKMVTGRNEKFDKIRQYKGLCGFSHPEESLHDHFFAGHAGTALSLALGVAKTRDLTNSNEYILPIIGDATLTCGVTLEALNNIPKNLTKFILILNDNKMSISNNVGCITNILDKLSNPFFQQFNLSYIGIIDGHNIEEMIKAFEKAKKLDGPVIVHLITQKGQGLQEAINNPHTYHGVKPFDKITGKLLPGPSGKNFSKIFGSHLVEMAKKDPSILAITPATSVGASLDPMMEMFPERCLDVGIAESHAVTFAGGAGYLRKSKVVMSIYATFLQRAFDNLFHDVCLQKIPVIFAIDRAYISSSDGSTHHGIYDISFLNAMPNMVIAQPRDGQVLKELLESAFDYKRPTSIRYPNLPTTEKEGPIKKRPLGKGEILSSGKDLLIISLGHMNKTAMDVREKLISYGINATIFDPIFVKPLDSETLYSLLARHDKLVTIEEHSLQSGLGAIINHWMVQNGFGGTQTLNFGIPETFLDQGEYKTMLENIGLTPIKISEKIIDFFSMKEQEGILNDHCSISQ